MSDEVFKANCNEHNTFMFFQDFWFFSKATLFFLSLPLGNMRAMISKDVAHVHTRKSTPKDKSATKHFPSYFNSALGRNREYIFSMHCQKHPVAQASGKNELPMQEKLIKEKVLWDLYSKQCWKKLNLKLRFLMSYLHALPGEWHAWLEIQCTWLPSRRTGRGCAILDQIISPYRHLKPRQALVRPANACQTACPCAIP